MVNYELKVNIGQFKNNPQTLGEIKKNNPNWISNMINNLSSQKNIFIYHKELEKELKKIKKEEYIKDDLSNPFKITIKSKPVFNEIIKNTDFGEEKKWQIEKRNKRLEKIDNKFPTDLHSIINSFKEIFPDETYFFINDLKKIKESDLLNTIKEEKYTYTELIESIKTTKEFKVENTYREDLYKNIKLTKVEFNNAVNNANFYNDEDWKIKRRNERIATINNFNFPLTMNEIKDKLEIVNKQQSGNYKYDEKNILFSLMFNYNQEVEVQFAMYLKNKIGDLSQLILTEGNDVSYDYIVDGINIEQKILGSSSTEASGKIKSHTIKLEILNGNLKLKGILDPNNESNAYLVVTPDVDRYGNENGGKVRLFSTKSLIVLANKVIENAFKNGKARKETIKSDIEKFNKNNKDIKIKLYTLKNGNISSISLEVSSKALEKTFKINNMYFSIGANLTKKENKNNYQLIVNSYIIEDGTYKLTKEKWKYLKNTILNEIPQIPDFNKIDNEKDIER